MSGSLVESARRKTGKWTKLRPSAAARSAWLQGHARDVPLRRLPQPAVHQRDFTRRPANRLDGLFGNVPRVAQQRHHLATRLVALLGGKLRDAIIDRATIDDRALAGDSSGAHGWLTRRQPRR